MRQARRFLQFRSRSQQSARKRRKVDPSQHIRCTPKLQPLDRNPHQEGRPPPGGNRDSGRSSSEEAKRNEFAEAQGPCKTERSKGQGTCRRELVMGRSEKASDEKAIRQQAHQDFERGRSLKVANAPYRQKTAVTPFMLISMRRDLA